MANTDEIEVKTTLKEGDEWRDGIYFKGWNEYQDEVRRVYSLYVDFVPYPTLRSLVRLIRQIPLTQFEEDAIIDREEEYEAAMDVISAAEEINNAASNAAAQMTVSYPTQGSSRGLCKKAQKMREIPNGIFHRMGFTWTWEEAE